VASVAAARHYARALALSPHHVDVHHARGWYAIAMGRCEEAIAELTRAQALDPLSVVAQSSLGVAWYFARDYKKAVEQYQTSIEMEPDRFVSHYLLGLAYEQQSRLDEAIAELTIARRSLGDTHRTFVWLD
jgi:tetratricopeptide (TPR) repeat protein